MAGYDWGTSLGNSIGNFVGSGAGQSLLGAGAGYLADKYIGGGSGRTGAAVGGLLGAGNYMLGEQGNMYGEGSTDFGNSAMGGLLGTKKQPTTGIYGEPYSQSTGNDIRQIPQETSYMSRIGEAGMGLLGGTAKAVKDNPIEVFKAYTDYKTGRAAQENAQSEINYRNRIASLQESNYLDQQRRKQEMEQNAIGGFNSSGLSSRNYYEA